MREILFRGKCKNGYDYSNGDGWVYGSLLQKDESVVIVRAKDIDFACKLTGDGYTFTNDFSCIPVDPNTIGQFTGLTDKNGSKIFEGDVFMSHVGLKMTIEWQNDYCLYMMRWLSDNYQMKTDVKFLNKSEIIGNIHDNNNEKNYENRGY